MGVGINLWVNGPTYVSPLNGLFIGLWNLDSFHVAGLTGQSTPRAELRPRLTGAFERERAGPQRVRSFQRCNRQTNFFWTMGYSLTNLPLVIVL